MSALAKADRCGEARYLDNPPLLGLCPHGDMVVLSVFIFQVAETRLAEGKEIAAQGEETKGQTYEG